MTCLFDIPWTFLQNSFQRNRATFELHANLFVTLMEILFQQSEQILLEEPILIYLIQILGHFADSLEILLGKYVACIISGSSTCNFSLLFFLVFSFQNFLYFLYLFQSQCSYLLMYQLTFFLLLIHFISQFFLPFKFSSSVLEHSRTFPEHSRTFQNILCIKRQCKLIFIHLDNLLFQNTMLLFSLSFSSSSSYLKKVPRDEGFDVSVVFLSIYQVEYLEGEDASPLLPNPCQLARSSHLYPSTLSSFSRPSPFVIIFPILYCAQPCPSQAASLKYFKAQAQFCQHPTP